jgi:hypothetical protein
VGHEAGAGTDGILALAAVLGANNGAQAGNQPTDVGNVAIAVGGRAQSSEQANIVGTNGRGSIGFALFGKGNTVGAYGPLAVAGSIGQTTATVYKTGPGFNINGLVVGGAAATGISKPKTRAAASTGGAAGKPSADVSTTRSVGRSRAARPGRT